MRFSRPVLVTTHEVLEVMMGLLSLMMNIDPGLLLFLKTTFATWAINSKLFSCHFTAV